MSVFEPLCDSHNWSCNFLKDSVLLVAGIGGKSCGLSIGIACIYCLFNLQTQLMTADSELCLSKLRHLLLCIQDI